jgi:small subunit ribosomal protein S16
MAVRIRLTRVGATKQPTYRVVVADSRSARDGRALDTLGHYNPRTEPAEVSIDAEKARAWLAKGATPSETVVRLFRVAGVTDAAAAAAPATATRRRAAAGATATATAEK